MLLTHEMSEMKLSSLRVKVNFLHSARIHLTEQVNVQTFHIGYAVLTFILINECRKKNLVTFPQNIILYCNCIILYTTIQKFAFSIFFLFMK